MLQYAILLYVQREKEGRLIPRCKTSKGRKPRRGPCLPPASSRLMLLSLLSLPYLGWGLHLPSPVPSASLKRTPPAATNGCRSSTLQLRADVRGPMSPGSLVALVTPMRPDGSIDVERLRGLIQWHLVCETDGIVALGTTGELALSAVWIGGLSQAFSGCGRLAKQRGCVCVQQRQHVHAPFPADESHGICTPASVFQARHR